MSTQDPQSESKPAVNSLGEDESQLTIPDPQSQGREGDEHLDDIDQSPVDLGDDNDADDAK